jgi:lipid-A-disaccharide synthase
MRYYLVAGEASGDLHGSYLMKALQRADEQAEFRFWGGDLMAAVGGDLRKHYRELAFMGFAEVVMNLRTILGNFKVCKADILAYAPDVLILVDYPGFNLRMAKWARQQGIKVFYYISPQIWAWHSSRVHQIKAHVDRMFVILPFEEAFYQQYEVQVDYVGHPLLDVIKDQPLATGFRAQNQLTDQPLIALLPGSRKQEINRMLAVMLAVARYFPGWQFVVAGAPAQETSYYHQLFAQYGQPTNVQLVEGQTYALLQHAQAALVTSGTATLETALLDCPQIVCYRGNPLSYAIAKRVINVKYISLVNLVMDQPLVLELIQHDFNVARLQRELVHLMTPGQQATIKAGYEQLREILGDGGAAQRCADLMVGYLKDA